MRILILILALAFFGPGDGKKKGRRANALYERDQFIEAAGLFRDGIFDIQENGPGSVHAGLLNNLGASLFRQGEYEQAAAAFFGSFRMSPTVEESVRANYNAGNALAMQQELQGALDHYRSALLSDPDDENAKFNYEFVKRQLEERQQDQNQDSEQQQDQNQDNSEQNEQQDNSESNDQQEQDQQPPENQDPSESEQQQQNPEELSPEEAQRILQALENEEEQLLRQIQKMKTRPRRVEKDW